MAQFGMHLIFLSNEDPPRAIAELRELIAAARERGDDAEEHVCLDLLVSTFIVQKQDLREAEELARELVRRQPDATHLRMLARTHEFQGHQAEASALMDRAEKTADEHLDEAALALMAAMDGEE